MLYIAIILVVLGALWFAYTKSAYYIVTKNQPWTLLDKGKLGEYLTYRCLRNEEGNDAKFLFNLYLPKGNGETTEIDVLMIHPKGLFVFESKNYSGWIFGNEQQKTWCQTLPKGRGKSQKGTFYNPIMQNRTHVKYLREFVDWDLPIHSIVVFSERCELKKITLYSNDIHVIKRNYVRSTVERICENALPIMAEKQIDQLYEVLLPYAQTSAKMKQKHIDDINRNNNQ